jgi:hypothetical protein
MLIRINHNKSHARRYDIHLTASERNEYNSKADPDHTHSVYDVNGLVDEIKLTRTRKILFGDNGDGSLENMFNFLTARNRAATNSYPRIITTTSVSGSPFTIHGSNVPIQATACEISNGLVLILMRATPHNNYTVKILDTVRNILRDTINGPMYLSLSNASNAYYLADMVNLGNEKILVLTGDSIQIYKLFLFDERTETFATSFKSPAIDVPALNNMSKLSLRHLIPLSNNKILCNLYSNSYNSPRYLYIYHVNNDICLPAAVSKTTPTSDRGHRLLRAPDGTVYYLHGINAGPSNTDIKIYRFDTDSEELTYIDQFQIPVGNGDIMNAIFIDPNTIWVLYNTSSTADHYQYTYNMNTSTVTSYGSISSSSFATIMAPNGDLYQEYLVSGNMVGRLYNPLTGDNSSRVYGTIAGTVASCKPLLLSDGRILSITWGGGKVYLNLIDGPFGMINPYKPSKALLRSGII